MHIAAALRKPMVGILGGGHFGRFYPWGDPRLSRVAHVPMECYWCNWSCRYETVRCIREISPAVIAREIGALLPLLTDAAVAAGVESAPAPGPLVRLDAHRRESR